MRILSSLIPASTHPQADTQNHLAALPVLACPNGYPTYPCTELLVSFRDIFVFHPTHSSPAWFAITTTHSIDIRLVSLCLSPPLLLRT